MNHHLRPQLERTLGWAILLCQAYAEKGAALARRPYLELLRRSFQTSFIRGQELPAMTHRLRL